MKRFGLFFISCLAAALTGCTSTDPLPEQSAAHPASTYEQAGMLAQVVEFLNSHYVDENKVGYDRLLTTALRGMMRELDPYSGYLSPDEYSAMIESATGAQIGIGLSFSTREIEENGRLFVARVSLKALYRRPITRPPPVPFWQTRPTS